eukprot:GHVU01118937.1.p1 GENE.GHVU01118937.1~~GHVU01118937.1.p1  ORF type:complete len:167 (+),score=4.45 GHVU01118937.1:534-1034(+)
MDHQCQRSPNFRPSDRPAGQACPAFPSLLSSSVAPPFSASASVSFLFSSFSVSSSSLSFSACSSFSSAAPVPALHVPCVCRACVLVGGRGIDYDWLVPSSAHGGPPRIRQNDSRENAAPAAKLRAHQPGTDARCYSPILALPLSLLTYRYPWPTTAATIAQALDSV